MTSHLRQRSRGGNDEDALARWTAPLARWLGGAQNGARALEYVPLAAKEDEASSVSLPLSSLRLPEVPLTGASLQPDDTPAPTTEELPAISAVRFFLLFRQVAADPLDFPPVLIPLAPDAHGAACHPPRFHHCRDRRLPPSSRPVPTTLPTSTSKSSSNPCRLSPVRPLLPRQGMQLDAIG